jgi:hypothetical protein
MKPSELLKAKTNWYDRRGHSHIERRLNKYMDKDCVIAYVKECLGSIFIIKSDKKYFAFVILSPDVDLGGYNYRLTGIKIKDALKLMGERINIVDKELYGNLNKWIICDAL